MCSVGILLTACNRNDMEVDAEAFAQIKCKLKDIDARAATGEFNYLETEDKKEPLFDSLDILRIRYRAQKEEFDSLIGMKVEALDCGS